MSGAFTAVIDRLAAGDSIRTAARTVGVPHDFARAVAAEGERLGLVIAADAACGTCVPASSPACAGCPFGTRGGRDSR